MKGKAFATIFAAVTLCWPAVGSAQDPLVGSWKCEVSRPQSEADRPVMIQFAPGGLGFIVSGTDVLALRPFGQRSGLPITWEFLEEANQDQREYEFLFDEILYSGGPGSAVGNDSGLVSGRFPGLASALMTLHPNDRKYDTFEGLFRFYISVFIYDTPTGRPEAGAAIIDEEVVAADPTGAGGSTINCIRFAADPVYEDLRSESLLITVPFMDVIGD